MDARRLFAAGLTVTLLLFVSGCTSDAPPTDSASPLQVGNDIMKGTEGTLTWNVEIPTFSGSDADDEINRRVRAPAESAIAMAKEQVKLDDGAQRTLEGEGAVTTNDGRTVQVVVEFVDYLDGTAHPNNSVSTAALTTTAGQPILLSDVFTDLPAAYSVCAQEVGKALEAAGGFGDAAASGLAPKAENWSAWQSTPAGLEFHFQDFQLGFHGLPVYTVPWAAVDDLLTAEARELLAP